MLQLYTIDMNKELAGEWTQTTLAEVDSCQKFRGFSLFLGKCRVTVKDFHVIKVKINRLMQVGSRRVF